MIVATAAPSAAGAEGGAGPAFSPPVVDTTLVEPGWAKRPVRHGPRHAAADLVVTLDQQIYPAVAEIERTFAAEAGTFVTVPTSILAQHGWHLVDGELQGEPGR